MRDDDVKALLRDLDAALMLQFVLSVNGFGESFSVEHNIVRFVRLSRTLGELAYVLESSLQLHPVCSGINGLFGKVKAVLELDKATEKSFRAEHARLGSPRTTTEVNDQLASLFRLIDESHPGPKRDAAALLVAHRVRNHLSHDLDESFAVNDQTRRDAAKKLFLCLLASFFITRKLLGVWKS